MADAILKNKLPLRSTSINSNGGGDKTPTTPTKLMINHGKPNFTIQRSPKIKEENGNADPLAHAKDNNYNPYKTVGVQSYSNNNNSNTAPKYNGIYTRPENITIPTTQQDVAADNEASKVVLRRARAPEPTPPKDDEDDAVPEFIRRQRRIQERLAKENILDFENRRSGYFTHVISPSSPNRQSFGATMSSPPVMPGMEATATATEATAAAAATTKEAAKEIAAPTPSEENQLEQHSIAEEEEEVAKAIEEVNKAVEGEDDEKDDHDVAPSTAGPTETEEHYSHVEEDAAAAAAAAINVTSAIDQHVEPEKSHENTIVDDAADLTVKSNHHSVESYIVENSDQPTKDNAHDEIAEVHTPKENGHAENDKSINASSTHTNGYDETMKSIPAPDASGELGVNYEPKTVVSFSKDLGCEPNNYPDTVQVITQNGNAAHVDEELQELTKLKFDIKTDEQDVQINLVARPKTKSKYSSQTNLHTLGGVNGGGNSGGGVAGIGAVASISLRPRSASLMHRRIGSTLQLYRPQSADPKFERNLGSSQTIYSQENEIVSNGLRYNRNNKRFESVSSSNLLKFLLEEPIKRSWLCNSASGERDVRSPDEQSDVSSVQSRNTSSSVNFEQQQQRLDSDIAAREANTPSKMSKTSSNSSKDCTSTTRTTDYWSHESSILSSSSSSKPDLPGRVSFGKPHGHHDIDSSDCDNDKQEAYGASKYHFRIPQKEEIDSISAPGPVKFSIPNYTSQAMKSESQTTSNNLKKTVHFGATGGGEVLSETYEYPKCPSENCSCSTRSSSTASIHDIYDGKCACDATACKYARDSGCGTSTTSEIDYGDVDAMAKSIKSPTKSPVDDLPVIRDYKEVVGAQLENSIVKNLLLTKIKGGGATISDDSKFDTTSPESPASSSKSPEKQNNLSESKFGNNFRSTAKRNLFGHDDASDERMKLHNDDSCTSKISYASSSDVVINNYLKVTGNAPTNKKKDLKSAKIESNMTKLKMNGDRPTTSVQSKTREKVAVNKKKMQKSMSFHNLREDSNLDHFNLDKIDSWMSMHDTTLDKKQKLSKHASIENELEKCGKDVVEVEDDQGDISSQTSVKSDENSQDDSTYEEIVSVIKEIEDDKRKEKLAEAAVTGMELKLNTTSEAAESSSQNISERTDASNTPDKYKDILSYLDNVEDSCDKTLLETRRSMPESNRSEIEFVVEPDIAEDVPKLADLLLLPNHQLARRVIALSLRANELSNGLIMSKEQVFKLRNEKQKSIRAEKANNTNRLREQRKHYENIVKRHQGFIEQLLKDKGSLCEKVAALTRRLESQNQAWEHKLETEIARVKETTLAGEKIRRERWVRENTKKIKELTVKGLEMELNRMTTKHQQELTELKRTHQQQLLEALEEARIRHEQIESGIRESCAQDREAIIEKERCAIRERFERQMEEERKSFDEQKQKLLEEFALERERFQHELKAKDVEHQTKRQEIQREKEIEMEQTIAELQEKMSKQDEKYQNRINTIQKQYNADFEIWKREYENSCKLAQVEKENSIRQHYRAERDRQIDAIVSRMDAEALKNSEESEVKLSRFKEKYEKDLQDAEELEKSLREKYTQTRSKLAESDAQVRNLQAELKQLHMELEHSKKMCNDFLIERDQMRDNLRNELQSEVAALKAERDQEIQKIHKRVQQAIEKKDATIEILQKENGDIRERMLKLEAVIRQQRKDYCIK